MRAWSSFRSGPCCSQACGADPIGASAEFDEQVAASAAVLAAGIFSLLARERVGDVVLCPATHLSQACSFVLLIREHVHGLEQGVIVTVGE